MATQENPRPPFDLMVLTMPTAQMAHLVLLCAMTVYLEGCVGAVIVGDVTRKIEQPVIDKRTPYLLRPAKDGAASVEVLQTVWGPPEDRQDQDHGEVWKYRLGGLRWHGALLFVLIPLPLLVPFGYEHVTFIVKDGVVAEALHIRWSMKYGAYCGVWITKPWFCGAVPAALKDATESP